jgi:hypothetical protein
MICLYQNNTSVKEAIGMNSMKKWLLALLTAITLVGFTTACTNADDETEDPNTEENQDAETENNTDETKKGTDENAQ